MLTSNPALRVNQKSDDLGIPNRFSHNAIKSSVWNRKSGAPNIKRGSTLVSMLDNPVLNQSSLGGRKGYAENPVPPSDLGARRALTEKLQ